jgi:hypothetical protein
MLAIAFFVTLLAVSFWVGRILEGQERNYQKFFKD